MIDEPSLAKSAAYQPGRVRDGVAALLLVAGLLLPWNIHSGMGIAGTRGWLFTVLALVTLTALAGIVVSAVGRRGNTGGPERATLRLALSLPYLIVVAGFVLFSIITSIRNGGNGIAAPGVGSGALLGLAGALLAGQPVTAAADEQPGLVRTCRVIGWLSIGLAISAALANLYFRSRFVWAGLGGAAGAANLGTAITAVLYSVVAVLPVLIAGRWLIAGHRPARLATLLLGSSAAAAATLVWILPVGRDLDAFHGIAQNTGTAGVGYEGYLAWVAVAALTATATLRTALAGNAGNPAALWQAATRLCLILIAVWCAGTALLRIAGVVLAGVLGLPEPPYNSTALMAFDLVTAVLAGWLAVNGANRGALRAVAAVLFGLLSAMTICRVIVGVALVPRSQPLNPGEINPVFGNDLVQQVTSTFDVTLAVLAALLLAAVLAFDVVGFRSPRLAPVAPAAATPAQPARATAVPSGAATPVLATPRIARASAPVDSPPAAGDSA